MNSKATNPLITAGRPKVDAAAVARTTTERTPKTVGSARSSSGIGNPTNERIRTDNTCALTSRGVFSLGGVKKLSPFTETVAGEHPLGIGIIIGSTESISNSRSGAPHTDTATRGD
jgi:hypothetical protein